MKIIIKAFVYAAGFGDCNGKTYIIFNSDTLTDRFYTLVGPVDVEFEIPAKATGGTT